MQVSFVIPVYNQISHTKRCLTALAEHLPTSIAHEIILINDGSDSATRTYLDSLPAPIRVDHRPSNQGFATATNHGAKLASGHWLCLLNNDVEITPSAIETMLQVATDHAKAGIIGNVQITADTGTIDHAGIRFIDGGYPVHDRPTKAELKQRPRVRIVPAVTAACCLVDRAWFNHTGGLNVSYRNGFEDVDLCLRAREAGWDVYVAHRSVVRHAVSASEGRGRFEYRNAQQFLNRWGPRTLALEQFAEREAARIFRAERARDLSTSSTVPAVRAAQKQLAERAEAERQRKREPATVWVDLLRMEPKGANGGIKPLVYELLRAMQSLDAPALRFVILAQPKLRAELSFLAPAPIVATRELEGWRIQTSEKLSSAQLEAQYPPEVLYCPFGTSEFMRPGLPTVALLVDALHRDLPAALPIEEVNFREDNFKRILGSADWIQTLAQHGADRLRHHYDLPPTRCFHTYAAVHARLKSARKPGPRPESLPTRSFFFYPANFWPHKNHEVLLTAYRLYRQQAGADSWDLLLTGHPDSRMATLAKLSSSLDLENYVHFAGHLPDDAFTAVWQHAGALVFPSLHEGFGIPLVEAFHATLPVAAARASVLPEVGGNACAWFDPRDPHALAKTLGTVAADDQLREKLRARGTTQLTKFSIQHEARRLHHFLHAAARHLVP
jgi:GT2 family glycosyltransferase/glycosyltransferase involved in cell wall biosynthesis